MEWNDGHLFFLTTRALVPFMIRFALLLVVGIIMNNHDISGDSHDALLAQ
jgi:hypothetical protein